MLLVLAGLPEPVVNHTEHDDRGWWVRRFDLSYPSVRVAVEYDGRQHAESDRQWQRDLDRREELDNDGWRIVVVLARGIYREPERTLARVETRIAGARHGRARHLPGVAGPLPVAGPTPGMRRFVAQAPEINASRSPCG